MILYSNNRNNYKVTNVQRGNSVLAIKAGFWYVLGNFSAKAVTFITTPIFARLMTPFDYGEFSNFASWAAILMFITSVELPITLSRAYYDFKTDYYDYISSISFLGSAITVIFYILFLVFHDIILKIVSIPEQYIHVLFIYLLFSFYRSMFYARERTLYRYKSVAVIAFLSLFIPTIVSVVLVLYVSEKDQLAARIYGFYLMASIIGIYCALSLLANKIAFKLNYCKYALYLSIPLTIHYLSANLLSSTNVIITKNILGATTAAIVSIAQSTTHILTVLFQALSGALTTWIMDNLEQGNVIIVKKGTLFYTLLLALVTISIILLTPEVVYILGGKKYIASSLLIPGLAFASCIQATITIFTIILTYAKNLKATAIFTAFFSIISIMAMVSILPVYGYISLVYINIAVFSALFLISYLLVKKAGYDNVINLKGILSVLFVTGVVSLSSQSLYNYPTVRCILIGAFIVFLAVALMRNKEKLITIWRKRKELRGRNQ